MDDPENIEIEEENENINETIHEETQDEGIKLNRMMCKKKNRKFYK